MCACSHLNKFSMKFIPIVISLLYYTLLQHPTELAASVYKFIPNQTHFLLGLSSRCVLSASRRGKTVSFSKNQTQKKRISATTSKTKKKKRTRFCRLFCVCHPYFQQEGRREILRQIFHTPIAPPPHLYERRGKIRSGSKQISCVCAKYTPTKTHPKGRK